MSLQKRKFKSAGGVTLIETLIYVALVGLIVSSIVLLTSAVLNSRAKTHSSLILEENIRFALSQIVDRMSKASGVTLPASGSQGNTLTLSMTSLSENPTLITLSNGTIMITEGTNPQAALTSGEIEVTNLLFTRFSGTPPYVKVEIFGQLRNAMGAAQSTFSVSDTVTIRR